MCERDIDHRPAGLIQAIYVPVGRNAPTDYADHNDTGTSPPGNRRNLHRVRISDLGYSCSRVPNGLVQAVAADLKNLSYHLFNSLHFRGQWVFVSGFQSRIPELPSKVRWLHLLEQRPLQQAMNI